MTQAEKVLLWIPLNLHHQSVAVYLLYHSHKVVVKSNKKLSYEFTMHDGSRLSLSFEAVKLISKHFDFEKTFNVKEI